MRCRIILFLLFLSASPTLSTSTTLLIPPVVHLLPDQSEVEVRCKAVQGGSSLEGFRLTWELQELLHMSPSVNEVNSNSSSTSNVTMGDCIDIIVGAAAADVSGEQELFLTRSSLLLPPPKKSSAESVLTLSLSTYDLDCVALLRNSTLKGRCVAYTDGGGSTKSSGEDGTASEPFELRIPPDLMFFPFGIWWRGSPEQSRKYNNESKKTLGFVLGMLPPTVILLYIAFYLSCFRNSANQDANMFGSENL